MRPRRSLALASIPALLLATACSSTEEKSVESGDPARIVKFEATPDTVPEGGSATLTWITEHVSAVRIVDGDGTPIDLEGASAAAGSVEVFPVAGNGATYTLIATSERGGTALRRTLKIGVVVPGGPQIDSFRATPTRFGGRVGADVSLVWQVTGATDFEIESTGAPVDIAGKDPESGEVTVHVAETTTFRLIATNAAGSAEEQVTVTKVDPPTVQFTASSTQVAAGDTVTFAWETTGAETVELFAADAPAVEGPLPASHEVTLQIEETTVFRLRAANELDETVEALIIEVGIVGIRSVTATPEQTLADNDVEISWTAFGGTRVLVRASPDDQVVPGCDFTAREDIVGGTCTVHPDEEGTWRYVVELWAGVTMLDAMEVIVVAVTPP